jgi:hypothetical protein
MDNLLCHSIKNKNTTHLQCTFSPKNGEKFCGKHLKSKNIVLFKLDENNIINIDINDSNNEINQIIDIEKNKIICTPVISESSKEIFDKDVLFNRIMNNINTSIYSIRKSIKHCKLNDIIDTRPSKTELIKNIKNYIEKLRYFKANEIQIIAIQSLIRKWIILRRQSCNNDTDILTFNSKYDIPNQYFYIFNDNIGKRKYAYDIRTLLEIIKSDYPSCPYTFRSFNDTEKNNIYKYTEKLIVKGYELHVETAKLSPEEELEMKMKDVFHEINMLDNYTDYLWFKNLEIHQLVELYARAEDIWNYRSGMGIESKKKIVNGGIAFNIPKHFIINIKIKSRLQHILLDEFSRFTKEGFNRDEKKLGAILILSALVEVSYLAAVALPHLVQL